MHTWLYAGCLLVAGYATASEEASLVPVGVISTERPLEYSDPAFAASQHRLAEAYGLAIANAAEHFLKDVRLPKGERCDAVLIILPGGEVMRVEPGKCSFSPAEMKVVSDALTYKSLPYKGYEAVYRRQAHIALCSPREACAEPSIKLH